MAVHGGLLRLADAGQRRDRRPHRGRGQRRRARPACDRGVVVGVRRRLDGRGDHDGVRARRRRTTCRRLLERLIPAQGDYEHNRLNHDTNSHAHLRAALIGPVGDDPGRRRPAGPRHLAADRAARLRRPPARARRCTVQVVWPEPRPERAGRTSARRALAARLRALYSPVRSGSGWSARAARPEKESPSRRGATVFENSTACAPSTDPRSRCVSRFDAAVAVRGLSTRRCQD